MRERLLENLAQHNVKASAAGRPYGIEFSLGIAEVTSESTYETLVAEADAALYAVKRQRN